ncbi:hypothetical protein NHX12_033105 [Muraenolepis orangiensis]|uniref:Uncharacterized protein n=1 Tax=Muraenolepis orangiensis TaxID=630683 RepID=A0A9Q0IG10_9TELE|nr:hypothetical protein NHX12_033105 [Muraenolepis orangiensis]
MILHALGVSSLCLPSETTVHQLFSVARHVGAIPDISLDPVLTAFLSVESRASLLHQYAALQRGMTPEHLAAFRSNLTGELGGSSRVRHGGVGVVALALSVLFDLVAKQVPEQQDATALLFGIRRSSRIGRILHGFLRQIPGVANDPERMAEATELNDNLLKLELIDHYERMTNKKRMSSEAMRQWLAGAAVHLHMRIHQVRLKSVPPGSAESLRLSYKTAFSQLVQDYASYLRRNVRETPPGVGAHRPTAARPGDGRVPEATASHHRTDSGTEREPSKANRGPVTPGLTEGQVGPARPQGPLDRAATAPHRLNLTTVANRAATPTGGSEGVLRHQGLTETDASPAAVPASGNSGGGGGAEHSTAAGEGLLVIEGTRNVSHSVQHRACESPVIEQALAVRLLDAQDLDEIRVFFQYSQQLFDHLLGQRGDFDLKIRWRKKNLN